MANAAAKKAAAARKQTAATFQPILLAVNFLHLLLLAAYWEQTTRPWNIFGACVIWGLEYVAYQGILHDSETTHKSSDGKLVGGVYLDLLGFTLFIQFGTALWSYKIYWLLCLIPPVALWKAYSTFKGSMSGANNAAVSSEPTTTTQASNKATQERRQQRAERRRQKWS